MTQGNDKTVYFLGAGASKASDFDLPVMQGFFSEDDFPEREDGKYSKLKEFLNDFRPDVATGNINLEEVLTHLELTMEGFSWGLVDSSLHEIKKELYKYTALSG